MSEDNFKKEYQSIKAPEELLGRIKDAGSSTHSRNNVIAVSSVLSVAAAVAVIFVSVFMFKGNDAFPSVYLGNEKLTGDVGITEDNNGGISLARAVNEINCDLVFDFTQETKIFLSEGLLFDENGNIMLGAGEEASFDGRLSCVWTLPSADESRIYEISLTDKNGEYSVKLEFDRQEGIWTARLTK